MRYQTPVGRILRRPIKAFHTGELVSLVCLVIDLGIAGDGSRAYPPRWLVVVHRGVGERVVSRHRKRLAAVRAGQAWCRRRARELDRLPWPPKKKRSVLLADRSGRLK